MRTSQKVTSSLHAPKNVSVQYEKMFIYATALGFLSIAGIYLLLN